MAARQTRLGAGVALGILLVALPIWSDAQAPQRSTPARIVSLVPALTEMLFDIGAGTEVVGRSRYDTFPAEVRQRPDVGGLLDPDYEGILRLRPDLVLTYGSQSELERRLSAGGITFFSYRHTGVEGVLKTIRDLGAATGHVSGAQASARRLEASLNATRTRVRGLPRPRTLLVLSRERGSVRRIYASGGSSFEQDLLDIAGGINVFGDTRRETVQPSLEMLLTTAPDVIVELHGEAAPDAATIRNDRDVWNRLSSIPAVKSGRVHVLYGQYLAIPGPRLDQAAAAIARVLHPDAFR